MIRVIVDITVAVTVVLLHKLSLPDHHLEGRILLTTDMISCSLGLRRQDRPLLFPELKVVDSFQATH